MLVDELSWGLFGYGIARTKKWRQGDDYLKRNWLPVIIILISDEDWTNMCNQIHYIMVRFEPSLEDKVKPKRVESCRYEKRLDESLEKTIQIGSSRRVNFDLCTWRFSSFWLNGFALFCIQQVVARSLGSRLRCKLRFSHHLRRRRQCWNLPSMCISPVWQWQIRAKIPPRLHASVLVFKKSAQIELDSRMKFECL